MVHVCLCVYMCSVCYGNNMLLDVSFVLENINTPCVKLTVG